MTRRAPIFLRAASPPGSTSPERRTTTRSPPSRPSYWKPHSVTPEWATRSSSTPLATDLPCATTRPTTGRPTPGTGKPSAASTGPTSTAPGNAPCPCPPLTGVAWSARGGRSGDYECGFVGEYHGLNAIAQAELGEYPADVDLHGALGQVQAGRDFAVGHARGDMGEDVLLTAGESLPDLVGTTAAGRLWLPTGELADEAAGGGRGEDRVAGGDSADRVGQVIRLRVFEQETAGPRAQPGVDVVVQVEGGQDQDF